MDSETQFHTGLDIGTSHIRAVILSVAKTGEISVVGYNEGRSAGMRKGVPANLAGPAEAIDKMLGEAERMGGYDVNSAIVDVGGSSVCSIRAHSVIAFDGPDHEVNESDLARLEESALNSCDLTNREILDITPLEYALDGQPGIKDPLHMSGSKLELRLSVVSALSQVCENVRKTTSGADVQTLRLIPNAVAAAAAVLSPEQKENGVAVVDFGAATTSVAIYEEGDLQYVGVVPAGSHNITNDLAIVLAIDPQIAEEIKTRYITGDFDSEKPNVIRVGEGHTERFFDRKEVEEVVKARLDDILGEVRHKIKAAHYDQRLPEGIVMTGGGAKLRDLSIYASQAFEAAVKVGLPGAHLELGGVASAIKKPEFAVSLGLALLGAENRPETTPQPKKSAKKPGLFKQIFSKI